MKERFEYLPELGVEKARVVALLKAEGDAMVEGDPLILVESDKAQIEVPAALSGRCGTWFCQVGDELREGMALCSVADSSEMVPPSQPNAPSADEAWVPREAPRSLSQSPYAGPGARQLARRLGVALETCVGSGPKGRITRQDVARAHHAAVDTTSDVIHVLTPTQRASAAHLSRAWHHIPHVTHGVEVNVTELEHVRLTLKKTHHIKCSLLVFVVKAVSLALKDFPKFSGRLSEDGGLLYRSPEGINIAVNTDQGLCVPRLERVAHMDCAHLISALEDLVALTRSGKAKDKMMPGEITISSLGGLGGSWFTPIINAPQIAIIGVMQAEWRPQWCAHAWVPRYQMPLVLSYDHRAVDGVEAQLFLNAIKRHLEVLADGDWLRSGWGE